MYWKILVLALLSLTDPGTAPGEPTPQDEPDIFIPSETLPADTAVSFPVDI